MSTSDFRSFRLYRPRRVTVSRFVEDYSIEERLKLSDRLEASIFWSEVIIKSRASKTERRSRLDVMLG